MWSFGAEAGVLPFDLLLLSLFCGTLSINEVNEHSFVLPRSIFALFRHLISSTVEGYKFFRLHR